MTEPEDTDATTPVVVSVVRSGGMAGIRKQWRAEPPASDIPHWRALVDQCPWDDTGAPAEGNDRFIWHITACTDPSDQREAEIPDSRLRGPWRTLVDEVRDASSR